MPSLRSPMDPVTHDGPVRGQLRRGNISSVRSRPVSARFRDARRRLQEHYNTTNATSGSHQASYAEIRPPSDNQPNRLRRRRTNDHTDDSLSQTIHSFQEAVTRLNDASLDLDTLLREPLWNTNPHGMEDTGNAGEHQRHSKRRKLDTDRITSGRGFRYGHRGSVVPGPLNMEIVSCDGGHFSSLNGDQAVIRDYWPENILRNDRSVYCTERSECSIILRHMGEATFCITKVVIKAPETGFTAP